MLAPCEVHDRLRRARGSDLMYLRAAATETRAYLLSGRTITAAAARLRLVRKGRTA